MYLLESTRNIGSKWRKNWALEILGSGLKHSFRNFLVSDLTMPIRRDLLEHVFQSGKTPSSSDFKAICKTWLINQFP